MLTFLNTIFKNAFRQTHLKQIGRDPKFFNYENPIIDQKLSQMNLQVLEGYKASVFMTEMGLTVAVDTLFRFESTITCLDKIKELKRNARDENHFQHLIQSEVVGSSVIACWGNKRIYRIHNIDFSHNPTNLRFFHNEQEMSVAEYMQETYNLVIKD